MARPAQGRRVDGDRFPADLDDRIDRGVVKARSIGPAVARVPHSSYALGGESMYALLVTADVEPGHEEEGLEYLRAMLPDLRQIPGLVSGHWLATTTDGESLAVVMFEDEAPAKQMAEIGLPNAPQPPGAKFRRAEVREVVAQL